MLNLWVKLAAKLDLPEVYLVLLTQGALSSSSAHAAQKLELTCNAASSCGQLEPGQCGCRRVDRAVDRLWPLSVRG